MDANFSYVVLSLCLLIFIKLLISSTSFSKRGKNLPPSPPSLPIIGHLYLLKQPLHVTLARLSARLGPILFLRFGTLPAVIVSSATLAEECFTKNDVALASRPLLPSIKNLTYNYTVLGTAPYGAYWRNIRRIASVEILSSQRLNSFTEVRANEVSAMANGLFRESTPEGFTRTEMRSRLFGLSLNILMTMVSGRRFDDDETSEETRQFKKMAADIFSVCGVSDIGDFLPVMRWVDFTGSKKKVTRLTQQMDTFLQGLIEEQRRETGAEDDKKTTMIGVMLSLQKSDPDYYTDEVVKALVISMLVAGTDTSSGTIEWAMSLLLNNPEKLKKAQAEIDTHVEKGRLLQESDIPNLPYLRCIITETLRLYPAGPLLGPHLSTEECTIGGFTIPSGTMLLCNAYAIHRDPKAWEEPNKFMPERFEEEKGNEGVFMIPFGMGRRRCPGEGLAMRVVGLELGTLIQCFEWKRVGPEEVDMSQGYGLSLPKVIPLEALYRPRKTTIDVLSIL